MSSNSPTETQPSARAPRWPWFAAFVAVLVIALVVVVFVTTRNEDSDTASTTAPSSTTPPTQTSAPTTTSPTTAPAALDTTTAVWPDAASTTRYSDPVAAARSFAVDFVGFVNPSVGSFRAGDVRSGEVDVRGAGGRVTTVLVRQLGSDGTWWVLGAGTANVRLQQPAALATISSPVRLQGRSSAFEGTVQTEVRQDGAAESLGSGYVTGGSGTDLGPFDGTLAFTAPTAPSGAVVLYTVSTENGQVSEATVVRVRFAGAG